MLHCVVLRRIMPHHAALHCIMPHAPRRMALHCAARHTPRRTAYTASHCTALCRTVLCCIVLYRSHAAVDLLVPAAMVHVINSLRGSVMMVRLSAASS